MKPVFIANRRLPSWPLRIEPIARGTVDVWCVSLNTMERRLEYFSSMLTRDEIHRAKAFKFERHRRRFCIARGMLRVLLSEYLGCAANKVSLTQGIEGKPALATRTRDPLHFNISHSADLVAYSFCREAQVGTDVEFLDRSLHRDLVVNRAFTQAELDCYYAAPVSERLQLFYRLWARKEARLKARGLRMAHIAEEALEQIPVMDFTFGTRYVGAVAVVVREPLLVRSAAARTPRKPKAAQSSNLQAEALV
jgi:phosphopantetheinyl transferase